MTRSDTVTVEFRVATSQTGRVMFPNGSVDRGGTPVSVWVGGARVTALEIRKANVADVITLEIHNARDQIGRLLASTNRAPGQLTVTTPVAERGRMEASGEAIVDATLNAFTRLVTIDSLANDPRISRQQLNVQCHQGCILVFTAGAALAGEVRVSVTYEPFSGGGAREAASLMNEGFPSV